MIEEPRSELSLFYADHLSGSILPQETQVLGKVASHALGSTFRKCSFHPEVFHALWVAGQSDRRAVCASACQLVN